MQWGAGEQVLHEQHAVGSASAERRGNAPQPPAAAIARTGCLAPEGAGMARCLRSDARHSER